MQLDTYLLFEWIEIASWYRVLCAFCSPGFPFCSDVIWYRLIPHHFKFPEFLEQEMSAGANHPSSLGISDAICLLVG